jgi:putative transposase
MNYHIIFTTKYREDLLDGKMNQTEKILIQTATKYNIKIDTIKSMADHVHLLVISDKSTSKISRILKSISAIELRRQYPELKESGNHLWAKGYFAREIPNKQMEVVRRYIKNQNS